MKLSLYVLAFLCLQLTCRAQEEEFLFDNAEVSINGSDYNPDYDTPQLEAVIEEPLYDYVEEQDCIPEVEAVLQEDGSYVYEEVKSCPSTDDSTSNPDYDTPQLEVQIEEPLYDYVEEQDCIPEVEAVLQEDGSYVYEEVKSCPPSEDSTSNPDYDTPQLEAVIEEPLYDYVEDQDCIPEVEAVLQEDGSYVYEEVKSCPPTSTEPIDYDTVVESVPVEEEATFAEECSKTQKRTNLRRQA